MNAVSLQGCLSPHSHTHYIVDTHLWFVRTKEYNAYVCSEHGNGDLEHPKLQADCAHLDIWKDSYRMQNHILSSYSGIYMGAILFDA